MNTTIDNLPKRSIRRKVTRTKAAFSAAIALVMAAMLLVSGCAPSTSSSTKEVVTGSQTDYLIQLKAINNMCNDALKLSITDVQRRPTSIFSGSRIDNSSLLDGTSESKVSEASSTEIAIQIDMSYTWNVNTYSQAVSAATGSSVATPSTLGDLLMPGTLMFISGTDSDGNPYMSADVITPDSQSGNALAINAQWDYNIMNSSLPETTVTKTGSVLFRVPSSVNDLTLNMMTPMGGQPVSATDPSSGSTAFYQLELS